MRSIIKAGNFFLLLCIPACFHFFWPHFSLLSLKTLIHRSGFLRHFFCISYRVNEKKTKLKQQTKPSSLSESSSCFDATLLMLSDLNEVLRRIRASFPFSHSTHLTQFSISFAELCCRFKVYSIFMVVRQKEEKFLLLKWSFSFPSISFWPRKTRSRRRNVKLVTEKNRKWPTC